MKRRKRQRSVPDIDRAVARSLRRLPATVPKASNPTQGREQVHTLAAEPSAFDTDRDLMRPQDNWFWAGGILLIALGIVLGVGAGGKVLGHSWNFLWLSVGVALIIGGIGALGEAWVGRQHIRRRVRWGTVGVAILLTSAFIVGALTTDMVNGRPVWNGSQEAHVNAFAGTTLTRLYRLGEIDGYFELSSVDGRLKITELEDAYREVEGWAMEYSNLRSEDLPAVELGEVELMMESTTFQALAAIDTRVQWLQTGDPVALRTSEEHRQRMQQGVLAAGVLLRDAAAVYGIVVGDAEGGLVE